MLLRQCSTPNGIKQFSCSIFLAVDHDYKAQGISNALIVKILSTGNIILVVKYTKIGVQIN